MQGSKQESIGKKVSKKESENVGQESYQESK